MSLLWDGQAAPTHPSGGGDICNRRRSDFFWTLLIWFLLCLCAGGVLLHLAHESREFAAVEAEGR